ncbi:dehydrogenase [Bordetella genomosp. 5]|uniref:YciI family protein n=1 Tax=Bordetella genomosp. 5 TaxID=1395608 RepID=UPI000B9E19D1|nr:YciI family protein [Bordetella genomosp. 5]OZI46054.1 dehydrogenase [Bordetella genomosp. 5]
MSYALLIVEPVGQRATRSAAEGQALYDSMLAFAAGLRERGILREAQSLLAQDQAVRVQVREGQSAELKEMVGGFFLIDCETDVEALEIARACPAAQWCTVEVRKLGPCFM